MFLYRESELSGKGSWHISQELVYQWLGAFATPFWWSDAHINNALVRYVTAYTTLKVSMRKFKRDRRLNLCAGSKKQQSIFPYMLFLLIISIIYAAYSLHQFCIS